jgi:hypothetical protein
LTREARRSLGRSRKKRAAKFAHALAHGPGVGWSA